MPSNCMIMLKILFFLIFCLTGCGGGGGNDSNGGGNTYTPPPQPQFPKVAGTYSVIAQEFTYECNNGAVGVLNSPIAGNIEIQQTGNVLTAGEDEVREEENPEVGTISVDYRKWEGLIESNGDFSISRMVISKVGDELQVIANYNLVGSFSNTGWDGEYSYTLGIVYISNDEKYRDFVASVYGIPYNPNLEFDSCTYYSDFSGELVSSSSKGAGHNNKIQAHPPLLWDSKYIEFEPYTGLGATFGPVGLQ